MSESGTCNLCGGRSFKLFKKAKSLYSEDFHDVIQCARCGLVCVSDVDPERVIDVYRNDPNSVTYFLGRQRRDGVLFNSTLKELSNYREFRSGMRLLDIGCGIGTFLNMARSEGWDVTGLEPNVSAAQYAVKTYGLNVIQGTLNETSFPAESFDVVTMIQTLEHVPDPMGVLAIAQKILKRNGLIYIEVPNLHNISFLAGRFLGVKDRVNTMDPTAHLFYFTSGTLKKMVQSSHLVPLLLYSGFNKSMLDMVMRNSFIKRVLSLPYRVLCKITRISRTGLSIQMIGRKE